MFHLKKTKIIAFSLIGFLIIILAFEISLWNKNLSDEKELSRLRGMPVDEAMAYMRHNKQTLNIEDIRKYSSDFNGTHRQWIIVELRRVSLLGVIISLMLPVEMSDIEITGLLYFPIDDGKIGYPFNVH